MSSLGVAIVGCRAVAPLHAEAIVRADGAHLAVLCDVDPEPAAVLSRRYGGDVVTSFDDVLTRSDVAIVDLVTPDELHASMAIAAADAGKHALVEKPIAMNLSELEEIMAASARNRVRIMCAQSMRFRAKSRRVDKIVRSGEIGDPVFVRISNPSSPFWTPEVWQRSALHTLRPEEWLLVHNGMHQFDYLSLLLGCFPEEVYSISHPGDDWLRVHEYVAVNIRFQNGALALIEENRIMHPPGYPFHAELLIVGTRGVIDGSDHRTFSRCSYSERGLDFPGAHVSTGENEAAFAMEVQELVDAVRYDRQPAISLEFSREVLRSVRAAARSMLTGSNVAVTGYREAGGSA